MIEVQYLARLGNQLFQYCFGRILAEELGYALSAPPIPGFAGTFAPVNGLTYEAPVSECLDRADLQAIITLAKQSPRRIVVSGYMQRYEYYEAYRKKIRQWLAIQRSDPQPDPDGLVVHIRLGDYLHLGWTLAPGFYRWAISQERYSRLYIVTDEPESPYLKLFARYNPVIIGGSAMDSLRFIRSARRIVLSQSTFSWWGAYLSDAEKVYFPITKRSLWNLHSQVNLRIPDPRYVYVKGVNTVKLTPSEEVNNAVAEPT